MAQIEKLLRVGIDIFFKYISLIYRHIEFICTFFFKRKKCNYNQVMKKKILVFIVTYHASFRIVTVLNKIKKINKRRDDFRILISDDCSTDDTIAYINKIKSPKRIKVILNKKNLGYGANIKRCLSYALKKKFDYAIMIHGDDQYDAKYIPIIVKKLKEENIHAVTGSRMLNKPGAIDGGMPIYKFIGNIVLTKIFNILYKTNFTDCHTGLWGYNLKIFKSIKLNKMDDGFNFDNSTRISSVNHKFNIKEISIKTYYRTEISRWHIIYAFNFLRYTLTDFFKGEKL